MHAGKATYRIAWVSPEADSSRYLLERFVSGCRQVGWVPDVLETAVLPDQVPDCDRIVLVAPNRCDYPQDAIDQLTCTTNIVPWGVVTDSWLIGSRRSGLGQVTHWQQPWFRWWDSWSAWFFPASARPGSLNSHAFGPLVTAMDYALPSASLPNSACDRDLAILCSCRKTALMLQQQAQQAGWTSRTYRALAEVLDQPDELPEDILWDDSLLTCLPNFELAHTVEELLDHLTEAASHSRLIACIGLENLHLWPALRSRENCEILVKPSYALALSNYLYFRSHSPAVNGNRLSSSVPSDGVTRLRLVTRC